MSITLELPRELEAALSSEAAQQSLSVSEYIARLLATGVATAPRLRSGADVVEYWKSEGLIGTRPDIADAPARARQLRAKAERRSRN